MPTIFVLEIKDARNNKVFNFFNGRFSVVGDPMDMIFGVFSETIMRLLKSRISHFFFSKYSKSYSILNAKSCLKSERSLNKKTGCFGAIKLHVPNRTL